MSNPFNPNQQPMPGSGQYPTGQQLGGAYGQQPGQQMPGAGIRDLDSSLSRDTTPRASSRAPPTVDSRSRSRRPG